MMNRITRYWFAFATVGAVVAIALLAYDHFVLIGPDGYNTASPFDATLIFTLCPPCLGLMALERAHGVQLVLALSWMVAMNAGLYGAGGCLVSAVAVRRRGPDAK